MTMTKTGAAAPTGSQTTTTFQLGTYNATTDTFTQSLDLNDQVTYFLKPGKGGSPNPKMDQKSTAIRAENVRNDGSLVVKDHLDNIVCTAVFTIKATTPQGVSDAWNSVVKLIKGQQGSKGGTLCLRFAWPQSAAYSYLDVQYAAVTTPPGSPLEIQAKASTGLVIALEGGYAWRGDRLTYQNLVPNAGFEYPIGGTLAPAVLGFSDAFANVNAYAVQAGSNPTTSPANTYTDIVFANIPAGGALLRYYRLGLGDSGTTSLDISGNAQAGTTHGSPTMAVAGLISGDTDTCYTFATASSQYVSIPNTGLPTGNAAMSLAAWVKDAASPGALAVIWGYGDTTTNHHTLQVLLDTSNKAVVNVGGSTLVTTAAGLSTGAAHFVVATWDGTTITLYVDGVSIGTATPGAQAIPSNPTVNLGATSTPNAYFAGQIDEACIYSNALSSGQVTALYNAGHSGATGNLSNAISFPASSRVAFGSSAWGAMQTWAVRFRYATSQVGQWYVHYTDANDYLLMTLQSGANGFALKHDVASTVTTVAQATVALQHEAWYWLQVTQFPSDITQEDYAFTGPPLRAVLSYDSNGAVGTAIATLTGTAASFSVALLGKPQIAPTGAALVMGGVSSGLGNAWYNWGPGGWRTTLNGGTGAAALSWDGGTSYLGMSGNGASNTYTGGPWVSNGAARIDAAAAGTLSAKVQIYRGSATDGTPVSTMAIPVAAPTDVLEIAGACKTNSVSGTATLSLSVTEYNSSGTLLRTDSGWTPPSKTAAQAASWIAFPTTTYTTGANCAFVDIACVATDSTANSAGNAFWFDNIQCQDMTVTGTTGMAYAELRSPNSPAQLQISGVQGTMAAPSLLALGTYNGASLSNPATFVFRMGKRATPTSGVVLVTPMTVGASLVLDNTSYGGYYNVGASGTSVSSLFLVPLFNPNTTLASLFGIYRTVVRYQSKNTTVAGLTLQSEPQYRGTDTFYGVADVPGAVLSGPIPTTSLWTIVDLGQVDFTLRNTPVQTDTTKVVGFEFDINFTDTNTTGDFGNSAFLLPVDGGVVSGQLYNPVGGGLLSLGGWFFCYLDGLKSVPGWGWNLGKNDTALAEPNQVVNNAGGTTATYTNLTLGADPYVTLDPTQTISGTTVNQFAVHLDDTSGQMTVMPIVVDFTYTPLWHAPR